MTIRKYTITIIAPFITPTISNYKTAVVAGRTMYIGNVKRVTSKNKTEQQSDAMYKSVVNKFDVFPETNKIEVNVQDGEDIIALEHFADRILQYKNKTLLSLLFKHH